VPVSLAEDLDRDGYTLVRGALSPDEIGELRAAFDDVWKRHAGTVDQRQLLTSPPFLQLMEHPRLVDGLSSVFGDQLQLLMYALRHHDAGDALPERDWHRDFSFVCDRTIAVNAIVYLDPTHDTGPTVAVPGSHRWRHLPGGRFPS
jgi:ectoine hydroxylase-related dioxygenase (phytanoyl-CoA dioxygenase family)